MVRRLVDISVPLQNDVPADLGPGPKIAYTDHEQSVAGILPLFPGLKKEDLPDGKGWAVETVTLSTHNGTHLDAPWHYPSHDERGPARPGRSTKFRWNGAFSRASSSISAISPTAMSSPPPMSRPN